ncbi:MAG TPA: hypothetical protein PKG60_15710 [Spirochaetota bacterium]|nr:hypothetical protein [Spirochaetota bacterium]
MKKSILTTLLLILAIISPLTSQDVQHKWQRFSGNWSISNSKISESKGRVSPWNVYELINYNTIVSLTPFKNYSSINFLMNITERTKTPAEFMISFNLKSESKSWYYHIYAFKLSGGFWGINKASLIHSDRADRSKPLSAKNNIFINEIASADCKIKYEKMYKYNVTFEDGNVTLYIDDEKILSAPFPNKNHDGCIAISSRNAKIEIDKITVKQNEQILFEDDFDEDSIYTKVIKATHEAIPKNETETKP